MRNKIIFTLVGVGVLLALASAYVYARPPKPQSPVFQPASNPYAHGIFANGIIESYQAHGENINIYPDVSGTVRAILVAEGESVKEATPLLAIDNTVQQATTDQQKAQVDAAIAQLEELKAQPRKENLDVARAQVQLATASLKSAQDSLTKQQHSFDLDSRSVSKDALDTVRNAVKVAKANSDVVTRQFDLTRAGAWTFDVQSQERQVDALAKAWAASTALLGKYTVRAPTDGVILSIQAALGSYVSSQGSYGTYTQGLGPIIVIGTGKSSGYMSVRCYVDEILIPRLPSADKMAATMSIRGTTTTIPLEFVRLQPYVSPKIELSDQRLEKVDLRVLPAIFRFQTPPGVEVYPGQMVDVYIGAQDAAAVAMPGTLRPKAPLVESADDHATNKPPVLLVKRPWI